MRGRYPPSARSVDGVVGVLERTGRAMTGAEVGAVLGLTSSYAQQLLAAAEREGRVEVAPRTSFQCGPGRGRIAYRAVTPGPYGAGREGAVVVPDPVDRICRGGCGEEWCDPAASVDAPGPAAVPVGR